MLRGALERFSVLIRRDNPQATAILIQIYDSVDFDFINLVKTLKTLKKRLKQDHPSQFISG